MEYEHKDSADNWIKEGVTITRGAHTKLQEQQTLSAFYRMRPSIGTRRVNLSSRACSCNDFDQQGIPCRHYIAALHHFGKCLMLWINASR
ncbi:hypothetical protein JG688_00010008 [Phytophthora aleatoria]|uniref:SWIM-type domain-containing protein n=1 Tax=Phytophthora aleatoria TaxID=2496075 RepID=A0A8J5IFK4_9STRA|nr:hypothetical protein JG688_00010008 [Phytophthora aleatoria]